MEVPFLLVADAQEPYTVAAEPLGQQRLAAWWQPEDDSLQKPCCCALLHEEPGYGRGEEEAGPKRQEAGQQQAGPRHQEGVQKERGGRHQEGVQKGEDPRREAVGQKAGVLHVGLELLEGQQVGLSGAGPKQMLV